MRRIRTHGRGKRTQGNFIVYGKDGERIAAFACESDKRVFESAQDLLEALQEFELEAAPLWDQLLKIISWDTAIKMSIAIANATKGGE